MNKFRIGDRVRLKWLDETDKECGYKAGAIFTVLEESFVPYCQSLDGLIGAFVEEQLELVDSPAPQWNGKVTVDDKEYKIEWVHVRFDLGEPNPHRGLLNDYENHPEKYNLRAMSYCWIIASDAVVVARGMAYCTMSDNFCRKTGRKLSLDRALHSVFSSPDERRQVWEQVLQYSGLVK